MARTRALDRVLLWGHYVIPHFHLTAFRVAYWDRFGRPAVAPKYEIGFDTWWVDPSRRRGTPLVLAYLARRLLLVVPTLFGIMLANFLIVQAAPGGPVDLMLARLRGHASQATARIGATGTGETAAAAAPRARAAATTTSRAARGASIPSWCASSRSSSASTSRRGSGSCT